MYPWSLNDYLLIITRKMVHNGDSWFVDLSLITNPDTGLAIPKKGLIPARFNLNAPYPNPFNPITRIEFSVPITNGISIIIYDLLGRQVEVLHNEITTPGVYNIFWDGSPFSSGVYLLRMESSSSTASSDQRFTQTRKVVLLK